MKAPRGPEHGFDERTWLRRQGVHVVLHVDEWHVVGAARWARRRRRPPAPVASALVLARAHGRTARARRRGAARRRRRLVRRSRSRRSAARASTTCWPSRARTSCCSRAACSRSPSRSASAACWGHLGALAAIGAYVLAVGPQPSVIRAAIAGAAVSVAWLAGRLRDAWHLLLVAACALLAWNPYTLFDAGFQLSFGAVAAIFVLGGPFLRVLEGYPMPGWLRSAVAISAACTLVTAPILWFEFGRVPLYGVVANALAEPAMPLLLGLVVLRRRGCAVRARRRRGACLGERLGRRLHRDLRPRGRPRCRAPRCPAGSRRRGRAAIGGVAFSWRAPAANRQSVMSVTGAVADPLVDRVRGRVREIGEEEAEPGPPEELLRQRRGQRRRIATAAQLRRRVHRPDACAVRCLARVTGDRDGRPSSSQRTSEPIPAARSSTNRSGSAFGRPGHRLGEERAHPVDRHARSDCRVRTASHPRRLAGARPRSLRRSVPPSAPMAARRRGCPPLGERARDLDRPHRRSEARARLPPAGPRARSTAARSSISDSTSPNGGVCVATAATFPVVEHRVEQRSPGRTRAGRPRGAAGSRAGGCAPPRAARGTAPRARRTRPGRGAARSASSAYPCKRCPTT